MGLVTQHGGHIIRCSVQQVITDNYHRATGRPHILLGTGKNDPKTADIYLPGQNIRRHVTDQVSISLRKLMELGTVDCIVGYKVKIFRPWCCLVFIRQRHPVKNSIFAGVGNVYGPE